MAIYFVTLIATGLGLFMMLSGSISSLVIFGCVLLLLVLVFRGVGAVHLHETVAGLQDKYAYSRRERQERKTFEHLQLQFRQAHDGDQWWQAICDAAQRMEFAWVSLKTTHDDGRVEEEIWRSPQTNPDLARIITMTIPLEEDKSRTGPSRRFEIAICANGSVEFAARRASLFGRLLDENGRRLVASETAR
jgi:hypothetical protein